MKTLLIALVALALAAAARADPLPVIHYHEVLAEMAKAGAKARGAQDGRVEYDDARDRVLLKARKLMVILGIRVWADIRMECTFVRDGKLVRLELLKFTTGPLEQNSARFNEARAGIVQMIPVESTADRVVILQAGRPAYEQEVR